MRCLGDAGASFMSVLQRLKKKIMKYSEDLDFILQKELTNVIELKKSEKGPFNKKYVEEYYQKFLNLQGK